MTMTNTNCLENIVCPHYAHTEAENPDAAIANARADAQAVNPAMESGGFLPLIVLPGHIEAELFYRDIAPW
jgi:hypothetical protein